MAGKSKAGAALIAAGVLLPFLVKFGGEALLSAEHAIDPVPDQGGMLLAYLAFWGSIPVGVGLGIAGLFLLLRRRPPGR